MSKLSITDLVVFRSLPSSSPARLAGLVFFSLVHVFQKAYRDSGEDTTVTFKNMNVLKRNSRKGISLLCSDSSSTGWVISIEAHTRTARSPKIPDLPYFC